MNLRSWFALCIGLFANLAAAKETIVWLRPDFPPAYIRAGSMADRGYMDLQRMVLVQLLPEFDHRFVDAPLNRIWHELGRADGRCVLGPAKTAERLKLATFSEHWVYTPAVKLFVRAENTEKISRFLDPQGNLDLTRLRSADDLTGAYTEAVTYGPTVDEFLRAPDRRVTMNKVGEMQQPVILLDRGRADFIFSEPAQLQFFQHEHGLEGAIKSFEIASQPVFLESRIACSKGESGTRIINRIDAILANKESLSLFLAPLKLWYSPSDYGRAAAMNGLP